jgi:cobalt-precorrin 5A hydrolase
MGLEKQELRPDAGIAIVAVTRHGVDLALKLRAKLPGSVCYVPDRHRFALAMGAQGFPRIGAVFREIWANHRALVCIMSTGIVVRLIAPLLHNKTSDPAVVVLDERGRFVISLVSGHLGGANHLAGQIAGIIGGQAVITTASDVRNKPAMDLIARETGLEVANAGMLIRASRAILEDEHLWIYDPESRLKPFLDEQSNIAWLPPSVNASDLTNTLSGYTVTPAKPGSGSGTCAGEPIFGIRVSEYLAPAGCDCLTLHPRNLVVGLGCNRGTPADEIMEFLQAVFQRENLSLLSIRNIASIDIKSGEAGILETANRLNRPVHFFSTKEIEGITVPNPSSVVDKHIGVKSVCEATALASAQSRTLVVEKRKTPNVTLAVARVNFT